MFKVGDIVKCVKEHDSNLNIVGKTGKIVYINTSDETIICVEFYNDVNDTYHCSWNFWDTRYHKISDCLKICCIEII